MPAKEETKEYVEKELPYRLLMKLYKNSRASLRELGKELNISYHVIHSVLKNLEKKYDIIYTLELDETKLGFTEGRIITVKFGNKPNIDHLKEMLQKDIFVQAAFLAEGDFDLLLYVVGLAQRDFQSWQWNLRVMLSEYKPTLKSASISGSTVGFLPLRNELIKECTVLSNTEKNILISLNENSRLKISAICKKLKTTPNRTIYIIKKLKKLGFIKKFSCLTQRSDKKIIVAYGTLLIPIKEHMELAVKFANELLKEDLHEPINDYVLDISTNGSWDMFRMCAFNDGEVLLKRGPDLLNTLWAKEEPKTEKAILTGVIVGKWPFHLEKYEAFEKFVLSEVS